ncbi:MAG TPA: ferritin-like domain-containing protein [Gemmataceae bacterium]
MAVDFVSQSYLRQAVAKREEITRTAEVSPQARQRTTAAWLAYVRRNAASGRAIPWERGADVTDAELAAIARSLQAWQLGETSEGRHLRAAAACYAERVGDADYPEAIDLFIREEQRHGELLGRFLDLAGVGRLKSDWGDRLFRAARYCLTNMEAWTTPVVMVETLAMIYYNAIRLATGSRVLRTICTQILADEVPHVRFQCERLAQLLCHRPWLGFQLTMLAQRLGFLLVVLLVWLGHRRALRAGGYGWRHYWRAAWAKMNAAWRLMDPRRYTWDR